MRDHSPSLPVLPRRSWLRVASRLPKVALRAVRWRTGHWLPSHLLRHRPFDPRVLPRDTPIDIIVVIVDHFEPVEAGGSAAAVEQVASWCRDYEQIAGRHEDNDGRPPQHTWFYPAECPNLGCALALSDSVFRGFGEVEFHLHHGHDTHASFTDKLKAGLAWMNQAGAMLTSEPEPCQRFAYIAGNWALDNGARDDALSGCNTELLALRQAGCYADFTFPSLGSPAQPRKTNAIYYAKDDPGPKSYDWGTDVAAGSPAAGDLMLFQGPLLPDWDSGRIEDSALELGAPPSADRLPSWLRANIHIHGRPEWIFIKLHTHAIQSRAAFLGPGLDAMFEAMRLRWNRPPFRLHFATAREAYNMVKAAEAGCEGDPQAYRDFVVPPPANRRMRCNASWRLLAHGPEHVAVQVLEPGPSTIHFAADPLRSIQGNIRRVDAWLQAGALAALRIDGEGEFKIDALEKANGQHLSRPIGREALRRLMSAVPPLTHNKE